MHTLTLTHERLAILIEALTAMIDWDAPTDWEAEKVFLAELQKVLNEPI